MRRVFGDTYFYLALMDPRDEDHLRADEMSNQFRGEIITTHWVLTEVGDALCRPRDRPRFLSLLSVLEADRGVTILPADAKLFERAVDLYRRRPDKEWPLTDCTSFVVMQEEAIQEALTADVHFEQAGFVALLRNGS